MVTSPSKRFEDGVLVERAISTPVAGESDEYEPHATKPYKTPLRTPRSPEDREAYAKERAQSTAASGVDQPVGTRAVQTAENKSVTPEATKTSKRSRKK